MTDTGADPGVKFNDLDITVTHVTNVEIGRQGYVILFTEGAMVRLRAGVVRELIAEAIREGDVTEPLFTRAEIAALVRRYGT